MTYQLSKNNINGVNIPENSLILTIDYPNIKFRFQGEESPYILCKFEDLLDVYGNRFSDAPTFLMYYNLNFNNGSNINPLTTPTVANTFFTQDATYYYYGFAASGILRSQIGWSMYRVTIAQPNLGSWCLNCIANNYASLTYANV